MADSTKALNLRRNSRPQTLTATISKSPSLKIKRRLKTGSIQTLDSQTVPNNDTSNHSINSRSKDISNHSKRSNRTAAETSGNRLRTRTSQHRLIRTANTSLNRQSRPAQTAGHKSTPRSTPKSYFSVVHRRPPTCFGVLMRRPINRADVSRADVLPMSLLNRDSK